MIRPWRKIVIDPVDWLTVIARADSLSASDRLSTCRSYATLAAFSTMPILC